MREILFRGYDKIAQCWCYGFVLRDADIKDRWYIMNNYSDGVIVEAESVGENTGFLDKNGARVFEGDIVETPDGKRGVVVYHEERAQWIFHDIENYNEALYEKFVKIVGTIYKNIK